MVHSGLTFRSRRVLLSTCAMALMVAACSGFDVLSHAIAFSPTFVTVQTARVIGDRVYILLLIGDSEGEKLLKKLSDGAEKTTN